MKMEKLIKPVFTLKLNYKIQPGLVVIGKYDGIHPCITAATNTDKIIIHSPHRKNITHTGRIISAEYNKEISLLNVNQKITALTVGAFVSNDDKDVLAIGTDTHILVYSVHENKDIFYIDCADGVKTMTIGVFGNEKAPLLIVGGNSSVHAYNNEGTEIFWTASGDVVTALLLIDYNKDGNNELIICAEDFTIKILKNDQIINEQIETEVVTGLTGLPESRFAYAVSNGTIGVYERDARLWRVKSKHFAIASINYDLLGKGFGQLITGWSNGKIDCRSIKTGDVLFRDAMDAGIAGIVEGDYRSIGKNDLICVSCEGEVHGYTTSKFLATTPGLGYEQDMVRELLAKKQALLTELDHYEKNAKVNENIGDELDSYENTGIIPANTRLQIGVGNGDTLNNKPQVEIFVSTNNNTIIRAVIIFAEGIFKGETYVVHPMQSKLAKQILVPLYIPKDIPLDIHIKALISYPNGQQFHVFEIIRQLPRFSMYSLLPHSFNKPKSFVTFTLNERLPRLCLWLNQNFLLSSEIDADKQLTLNLTLKCLRDNNTELVMNFEQNGKTTFFLENMNLAADLIQSLANFLKLNKLESSANFPDQEELLVELMKKLEEIQETQIKLNRDVADRLGQIRTLVVKAEDAKLTDKKEMLKYYNELYSLNQEMIGEYTIRLKNYEEARKTMQNINFIIQKASRLRFGKESINIINQCRNCIKNNNTDGLIKLIRNGLN